MSLKHGSNDISPEMQSYIGTERRGMFQVPLGFCLVRATERKKDKEVDIGMGLILLMNQRN